MFRQQYRTVAIVLALSLVLTQLSPAFAQSDPPAPATAIRVGSKPFTEQLLLGKMFVRLLQEAGYTVDDQTGLGDSAAVRAALEEGTIDLYPEYTGTALTLYNDLPVDALPNVADRAYELAKTLDEPRNLTWLDAAPLNNSFALFVRSDLIEQGIDSIDALAAAVNQDDSVLTICVESEFYGRADGLIGMEDLYDFRFPEAQILVMESDEVYSNLRDGLCDVAQGVTTDGRVAAWNFQMLTDTLAFFPYYQPAPVVRTAVLAANPGLADLLNRVMGLLDTTTMGMLNARVDLGADGMAATGDEEAVDDVALSFLLNSGLVKPDPIRVGSKEFTEQLLLGKLMILLLRDAGFEVEDLTGFGGTTEIRQAVEAGAIDIYPEYTGTATSVHHNIPVTALPTTPARAYVLAKSLDAPLGLVWLAPMNFNNTYTLMVRQTLYDDGIQSIADLATYLDGNDTPPTLCVETEFYARPDGLDGLQNLYGFTFPEENILVVETSDTYEKLRNGECDVAEGFATDGRIAAWNFANLADSLAFFPFYNPTPVVRQAVLDLHPEIADLLNQLSDILDQATMSALNARVDIGPDGELASGDEATVDEVAYEFLRQQRLVALPKIVVSSTDATEGFQAIMSNMFMLLLADAGYQPIDETTLGGDLLVRQAMLDGNVDLYLETVTTALAEYHGLPNAALPTTPERAYALAQNLDKENDVVWLDPLPYAEIKAIVASATITDLAISDLNALATYMNENAAPLRICMDNDFYGSALNGLATLEEVYDFTFQPENILLMDEEDVLPSMIAGECDLAASNGLDAATRGYPILDDPLGFFISTGSAPVMRRAVAERNADLVALINNLVARLDTETIAALDRAVELGEDGEAESGDEVDAYIIARDFLVNAGLIAPPTEAAPADRDSEAAPDNPNPAAPADDEGAPPADDGAVGSTNTAPLLLRSRPPAPQVLPVDTDPTIVVGSMGDTEQQLLGTMLVSLLRAKGYPVADRIGAGSSPDLRAMLERGEIDLYPEFTGVALSLYHNIPPSALPTTADGAFSLAKDLDEVFHITWFRKASFDSAYGLAVTADLANAGMRTLFDLGAALRNDPTNVNVCVDEEYDADPEVGWQSLVELYGFPGTVSPEMLSLPAIYQALRDGACTVGLVSRTDGRVGAWQLTVLDDPLGAFPNYSPAPIARSDLLTQYPTLESDLGSLSAALDSATMIALNAAVELGADDEPATGDEATVATVAQQFLCAQQLVPDCTAVAVTAAGTPTLTVAPLITPVLTLIPMTTSLSALVIASDGPLTTTALIDRAGVITVTTPDSFGVNVRATADAAATILTILPRSTGVLAIGRTADSSWLQVVTADDNAAWVYAAAVVTDPAMIARLPVVTPPALPTAP